MAVPSKGTASSGAADGDCLAGATLLGGAGYKAGFVRPLAVPAAGAISAVLVWVEVSFRI